MSERTDTTREALVDAAIRVFARSPSASLADVAAAAGVTRVTLHRLLGSRDELLREIAICSLAEMDEACRRAVNSADSATSAVKAAVRALVPVGDRCHFLWTQSDVWEEPTVAAEVARQNGEFAELIDQAKAERGIDVGVPTVWIVAAIEALVFAALTTARAGDIAVNDAARLAVETLFAGVGPNSTPKTRR